MLIGGEEITVFLVTTSEMEYSSGAHPAGFSRSPSSMVACQNVAFSSSSLFSPDGCEVRRRLAARYVSDGQR